MKSHTGIQFQLQSSQIDELPKLWSFEGGSSRMGNDSSAFGAPVSRTPVPDPSPLTARELCTGNSGKTSAPATSRGDLRQDTVDTCWQGSVGRMMDDFTRYTWEIRLLRGVKSAIAGGAGKEAFELLTELVLGGGVGRVCVDDPRLTQRWQDDLAAKSNFVGMLAEVDCNLISVDAFDLARIDRLLHLVEARREDLERKIARHWTGEAARLRDIIEPKFPT